MNLQQTSTMRTAFPFLAVTALILAIGFAAPASLARLIANTINPVARISELGRTVTLTGPFTCDMVQQTSMRVTVTQRSTGAFAEGRATLTCRPEQQQWEIRATTRGNQPFVPGPATAVALATTSDGVHTDDAHQWLVNITLEAE